MPSAFAVRIQRPATDSGDPMPRVREGCHSGPRRTRQFGSVLSQLSVVPGGPGLSGSLDPIWKTRIEGLGGSKSSRLQCRDHENALKK